MRITSVVWGDYDNDGDLDIAAAGQTTNGYRSFIYRNLCDVPNMPPSAPTGLTTVLTNGNEVILSWNAATDDKTTAAGLSYNITSVRPPTGGIMSPEANTSTGWRKWPRWQYATPPSWTLEKLPGAWNWSGCSGGGCLLCGRTVCDRLRLLADPAAGLCDLGSLHRDRSVQRERDGEQSGLAGGQRRKPLHLAE
jgi:hypothetical protein